MALRQDRDFNAALNMISEGGAVFEKAMDEDQPNLKHPKT
jgi:hypothetical protein